MSRAPYVKGYSEAGASTTRRALRGFNAISGSPTEDIDRNNGTLRQRSRMLYMSHFHGGGKGLAAQDRSRVPPVVPQREL